MDKKSIPVKERIWELDFFRGLALLLMIYFHIIYDLKELYNFNIPVHSGINYYIGKAAAILFILLSGISCLLSRSNVNRGLKVLLCAICITIITYLYSPNLVILFGILHFFGFSMIIAPFFKRFNKYFLALIGTVFLLVGIIFIPKITVSHNFLFPLGITNGKFKSSDYYPLLPWFGLFIYGIALGKFLYKKKKSLININIKFNIINFLGKHTLLVYLIHQPLIVALLAVINLK